MLGSFQNQIIHVYDIMRKLKCLPSDRRISFMPVSSYPFNPIVFLRNFRKSLLLAHKEPLFFNASNKSFNHMQENFNPGLTAFAVYAG